MKTPVIELEEEIECEVPNTLTQHWINRERKRNGKFWRRKIEERGEKIGGVGERMDRQHVQQP